MPLSAATAKALAGAVTAPTSSIYSDPNSVMGWERRKLQARDERKEEKNTLKEWYGMKRTRITSDVAQELELLKYRHLMYKDSSSRVAVGKTSGKPTTDFFEFGYEVSAGKNKRRKSRTIADEYLQNSDVQEKVASRIHRDTRAKRTEKRKEETRAHARAQKAEAKKKPRASAKEGRGGRGGRKGEDDE